MKDIQQVVSSFWPEPDGLLLDSPKAKVVKTIEWFDDRVYKCLLPPDFDPKRWEFFWSVTTILGIISKPWLCTWYGNLGTERARYQSGKAKDRGSLIHNAIAELLSFDDAGLGAPMNGQHFRQEDWLAILNFCKWYNEAKPRIIGHDFSIVSYQHKFAGTLDILLEIGGGKIDGGMSKPVDVEPGVYALDIKTGNESDDYFFQTAAYAQGVIENEIDKPKGTMIFYTDANTKSGYKLTVRNTEEMAGDFDLFLSAQKLFTAKGQKLPELRELPLGIQLQIYQ